MSVNFDTRTVLSIICIPLHSMLGMMGENLMPNNDYYFLLYINLLISIHIYIVDSS